MAVDSNKERIKMILNRITADSGADSGAESEVSPTTLNELKQLIESSTTAEVCSLLEEVDIGPFFAFLGDTFTKNANKESADEVIDIFGALLDAVSAEFIVSKFQSELVCGLQAKNDKINEIWLKANLKCLSNQVTAMNLANSTTLVDGLLQVIALMSKENSSTAKYCHNILLAVAQNSDISDHLFSPRFSEQFQTVKKSNEVVKLRVLSLMVSLASLSRATMTKVVDAGYLKELSDSLTDDPLFALNCVQLMTDLASTAHGVEYLFMTNCLKNVANQITTDDLMLADLLLPGYFALFGAVAHQAPSLVRSTFPGVIEKLIDIFGSPGLSSVLGAAVDVVGVIGRSSDGKVLLNSFNKFEVCLKKFGSLVAANGGDLKSRALASLAHLLGVEESDTDGEATTIAENWYAKLLNDRSEVAKALVALCRVPFLDVRLAAMKVLRVMATHLWGQKELAAVPRFVDYILDRKTEFDKGGKEAKFAIVRELTISPYTTSVFNAETRLRMRKFMKEGPLFVDTENAVAVEGE